MSKRTQGLKRRKNDAYLTWDPRPVQKLLRVLPEKVRFWEPCAGRGDLVEHLQNAGHICTEATDIDVTLPGQKVQITEGNCLNLHFMPGRAQMIITNPPWTRSLLHPMIDHFSSLAPTWLLFDADWMFTQQAVEHLPKCSQIVAAGRTKWIEDSPHDGVDNLAWYRFDPGWRDGPRFVGRPC